jgi:hypothetical protein
MAYLSQFDVDQQQNANMQRSLGQIGQGIQSGIESFNENRQRAIARRNKAQMDLAENGVQATAEELDAITSGSVPESITKRLADRAIVTRDLALSDAELNREAKRARIASDLANAGRSAESYETPDQKRAKELELFNKKEEQKILIEENKKASPVYRLEKVSGEGKNKVGGIASGLQSLDQMIKSLDDGHGPELLDSNTPFVGGAVSDTPYSSAARVLDDVVGRLQSGGAINSDELITFRAMSPRKGDSPQERKNKLQLQRDFLSNKLAAYNLKANELDGLGFKTISDYKPKNAQPPISQQPPEIIQAKANRLEELRAKKAQAQGVR